MSLKTAKLLPDKSFAQNARSDQKETFVLES